jgi:hypothetical protein
MCKFAQAENLLEVFEKSTIIDAKIHFNAKGEAKSHEIFLKCSSARYC